MICASCEADRNSVCSFGALVSLTPQAPHLLVNVCLAHSQYQVVAVLKWFETCLSSHHGLYYHDYSSSALSAIVKFYETCGNDHLPLPTFLEPLLRLQQTSLKTPHPILITLASFPHRLRTLLAGPTLQTITSTSLPSCAVTRPFQPLPQRKLPG